MKKLSIVILSFFAHVSLFAQAPAKDIFFEIGGPGIASVNYDMRFTKSEKGIGGRIGIGGFSLGSAGERTSVILIPVGVNYLLGKDEKNFFEVGAGFTSLINKESFNGQSETFKTSFGHLTFGYRLQPKTSGFTFRAHMTPVFGKGFFVPYYASLSFGYKF